MTRSRTGPHHVIVHRDPLVGRILAERFLIVEELARGTSGRVYRARQVGLDRPVAVKILNHHGGVFDAAEARRRFRAEATTLGRLTHDHTVRVFDAGTWEGVDYLAMELVDGPSLQRRLQQGPLPVRHAVAFARQICGSLAEAHAAGVVHRDLKPGNLLLSVEDPERPSIKVVDFGLVKHLDSDNQDATMVGRILGSPLYMAPEQVRGLDIDPRADLYALGVVLFEMLTGRRPFEHPTTAASLMAHLLTPAPRLSEAVSGLQAPPALVDLVAALMAKEPDQRPGSAAAAAAVLDHVAEILAGRAPWSAPCQAPSTGPELVEPEDLFEGGTLDLADPGDDAETAETEAAVVAPTTPVTRRGAPRSRAPSAATWVALAAAALLLVGLGTGLGVALTHTDAATDKGPRSAVATIKAPSD